ncbi:MAG: CpaF family protein [Myxococcota bacterium]|nr:CpaF family protein [Myxococcota bacterium]
MSLIDRLNWKQGEAPPSERSIRASSAEADGRESEHQELKSRVHNKLFDHLDLSRLPQVSEERIAEDIAALTRRILDEETTPLTLDERSRIVSEVQHEVFGLGPLEPLLQDKTICDILVNGPHQIYVERGGKMEPTIARFKDNDHLTRIIEKILSQVGRRVDESTPLVDARLLDGSRVNVIVPPLAIDGPTLSIRRFAADPLTAEGFVETDTTTAEVMALLEAIVMGRLNVLISGGTGAGKTTLLNILSGFIPENERIVTIEDSAELQLRQAHVVRLETRPANIEGRGEIAQRELVINSLRMRPDRIIVGEVRGGEALDMLQAMNTGHDGSLTTIHASSARDAISRVETLVALSGIDMPIAAVRNQIASAIDVVVQVERLADGSRCLTSVQEVIGCEGDVVGMQEIFSMHRHGIDKDGRLVRSTKPTGIRPHFTRKLQEAGIDLRGELFDPALYAHKADC